MTIDYIKEVITKAGGEYVGIGKLVNELVYFNNPKTKSTMTLKLEDVSIERVAEKLRCSGMS
jgi:hypothetical protein